MTSRDDHPGTVKCEEGVQRLGEQHFSVVLEVEAELVPCN